MEMNDFKILLVDDEQDVLEFMKYNMEKEGFLAPETHVNVELIIQFPNPNKK